MDSWIAKLEAPPVMPRQIYGCTWMYWLCQFNSSGPPKQSVMTIDMFGEKWCYIFGKKIYKFLSSEVLTKLS